MTYAEQLKNALWEYEGKYGRADVIGLTPAMYDLLKSENEKFGMKEPACGWVTFYGVKLEVQDVSEEPLFSIGGLIAKPKRPVDLQKIIKGITCHEKANVVKDCTDCPYKGNFATCSQELCADVHDFLKEKGANV